MGRRKYSLTAIGVAAVACAVGALLTGFAPADEDRADAAEVVGEIQKISPDAVAGSVATNTSGDAVTAASDGINVTVPRDAEDGIRLAGGDEAETVIGLPFGQDASDAVESQLSGVIVFDNNNGSSTVPVVRDFGVQISTLIENASAPQRYDYSLELPVGEQLRLNPDGSVSAVDAAGMASIHVPAPWAKDANGALVPTHYEVSGNVLTQVVDFTAVSAFPVVADPTIVKTAYTYSRADVERMWNTLQWAGLVCNVIDLPYMASLLCGGSTRLNDAVSSAHYQKKRLKATFNNCGFTYCNYYEYVVVS